MPPFPSQRHVFISLVKTAARRQCTSHGGETPWDFGFGPSSSHVRVAVVFPAQVCLWGYFLCCMGLDCNAGYRHLPCVEAEHALGPDRMARQPLFC